MQACDGTSLVPGLVTDTLQPHYNTDRFQCISYPMFKVSMITPVSSGFSGCIWRETKIMSIIIIIIILKTSLSSKLS